LAVADEEDVMAATNSLASHYRNIGYLMIAGLVMFYLALFHLHVGAGAQIEPQPAAAHPRYRCDAGEIGNGQWFPCVPIHYPRAG
jgi:hypothetical protein